MADKFEVISSDLYISDVTDDINEWVRLKVKKGMWRIDKINGPENKDYLLLLNNEIEQSLIDRFIADRCQERMKEISIEMNGNILGIFDSESVGKCEELESSEKTDFALECIEKMKNIETHLVTKHGILILCSDEVSPKITSLSLHGEFVGLKVYL